ncbi:hypothetical protein WME75_41380 [Sorangium sp. So ce1014]|uniref:hypothetical protein n=1 Tax=Sorangium sp. So ce1014 TaxID=3133326 RepID=UPI003F6157C0
MGDADITLRHLARRRPEDIVRALVPEGHPIEVLGWVDSQVTHIERRLDKALRLRIDGETRVLHVEFCYALRRGTGRAVHGAPGDGDHRPLGA